MPSKVIARRRLVQPDDRAPCGFAAAAFADQTERLVSYTSNVAYRLDIRVGLPARLPLMDNRFFRSFDFQLLLRSRFILNAPSYRKHRTLRPSSSERHQVRHFLLQRAPHFAPRREPAALQFLTGRRHHAGNAGQPSMSSSVSF